MLFVFIWSLKKHEKVNCNQYILYGHVHVVHTKYWGFQDKTIHKPFRSHKTLYKTKPIRDFFLLNFHYLPNLYYGLKGSECS